jgi:leucyl/phenylalanyl-tRNA--protein transferase
MTQLAAWPLVVATQALGLEKKTRIAFSRSAPDPDEVIKRYLRGEVLFGRSGARLAKFEWQSFAVRGVTTKETARVSSRMLKILHRDDFEVRFDQDFEEVIKACQEGRHGWTWLTEDLIDVYRKMNQRGMMATIGTYHEGRLIGGCLGITVGRTFTGMSVFHRENHGGSVAMAALVEIVGAGDGRWALIDSITVTPQAERFGATLVSEEEFLQLLSEHSVSGSTTEKTQAAPDMATSADPARLARK